MKYLSYDVSIGVLNTWVDKFSYITAIGEEYGGDRESSMAPRLTSSLGFHYSILDFYIVTNTSYKSEYYFSDSHNNKSEPYSLTNITFGK